MSGRVNVSRHNEWLYIKKEQDNGNQTNDNVGKDGLNIMHN